MVLMEFSREYFLFKVTMRAMNKITANTHLKIVYGRITKSTRDIASIAKPHIIILFVSKRHFPSI